MNDYQKSKLNDYAMRNLENAQGGNDVNFYLQCNKIYIVLKSGHTFELSDDEIKSRAIEYLRSELQDVENY
jgi:uncharacterized protein (DUF1499 family)